MLVPHRRRMLVWQRGSGRRAQACFNPAPTYPEMAKRMQLVGVVKIELTIASDGRIKEAKVIGGHPVLVDAAIVALRDWKYECGNSETKTQVEFKFHF